MKTNDIIADFFFFNFPISRKIYYLTREFRVKSHLKTDIALIASSSCVQFNAEFLRHGNEFSYRIADLLFMSTEKSVIEVF